MADGGGHGGRGGGHGAAGGGGGLAASFHAAQDGGSSWGMRTCVLWCGCLWCGEASKYLIVGKQGIARHGGECEGASMLLCRRDAWDATCLNHVGQ